MARLSEETEERIRELGESGEYSINAIGREVGVGKKPLYRVLREAGLVEPAGTDSDGDATEPTDLEAEEIGDEEPGDLEDEELEDEELEDEGTEPVPTEIVLGSRSSTLVGLALGVPLGAVVLYYAVTRGLIAPLPPPQR